MAAINPPANSTSDMTDVFNLVKEVFPSASVNEVDPSQTNPELNVTFPSVCGTLSVARGVLKDRFLKRMETLEVKIRYGQLRDVSEFNLSKCYASFGPLTGTTKINRLVAKNKGEKIEEALLTFLTDPNNSEKVRFLGLHPQQIDRNATDEDCSLFYPLFENSQENDNHTLFQNFRRLYPNLSLLVIRHFSNSQAEEENTVNEDPFRAAKESLDKRVIGQPVATKALAATFAEFQHQDGNKVLMFVGPTGVGKTEAAKAVASLFASATGSAENDSNGRIVFFPMNNHQAEHDVSKLFGSPAGYVGSSSEPGFAIEVNKLNPTSLRSSSNTDHVVVEKAVLLFDEFEKAHSKVKQSLLTLFDEGETTVQYTDDRKNVQLTYHFNQCLFICTSNLFSNYITLAFQAANNVDSDVIAQHFIDLNQQAPSDKTMSPELLGRMKIIPFGPIPKGPFNYQAVVKMKVEKTLQTLVEDDPNLREYEIDNSDRFYQAIEDAIYGEGIDLRKINRFLGDVKNTITARKADWGAGKTKKLQFSAEDNGETLTLVVKVFRYITKLGVYDVEVVDSFSLA